MKIVDKLVVKLIEDGAIEEDDREIYEYGLHYGIVTVINVLCTLTIGLCMRMFVETILFMLAYIPLRSYAGGIHAKTELRCFFYSNLIVVVILAMGKLLADFPLVLLFAGIVAAGIIIFFAPVEDQNKPLDADEVRVYGKKARNILLLDIVGIGVLKLFAYDLGVSVVVVSISSLAIFLVAGYIKNCIIKRKAKDSIH